MTGAIVTARINPKWAAKWLIISGAIGALGGWCLYDGLIVYPRHNTQLEAFATHAQHNPEAWPAVAAQHGWPSTPPQGPAYRPHEITAQWVMLALCAILSLWVMGMVLLQSLRRLEADDTTLRGTDGTQLAFADVSEIDTTQWATKGIAWVVGQSDGQTVRVRIDDYVFRGSAHVLHHVQEHTGLQDQPAG